ncbi:MAG: UDP-N-acetylglucosamine 1-carboxyvinyltransferase [Evtepia sp.]
MMDTYLIRGGKPLCGSATIHGSKNSVLPILAATILARGETILHNCPDLTDVSVTLDILHLLGCHVRRENSDLFIDTTHLSESAIPDRLMREMRSSILFLGALLARTGETELSCPGGCELGARPIDLHISAMQRLGTRISEKNCRLFCRAPHLQGHRIVLTTPSVGATENILLAATAASGYTIICNAAREPEIVDLQGFLRAMGARIWGAGTSVIVIEGKHPLSPCDYTIMTDRIVAATYISAVAATGGEAEFQADYRQLAPILTAFHEAGCLIRSSDQKIYLKAASPLHAIRPIYTAPYPGFPTDAQPMLLAALAGGIGQTHFVENIFSNRFQYTGELAKMGADIQTNGNLATVCGTKLHAASVLAHDLRGGAALVVAALATVGTSEVCGLSYIRRGYDKPDSALRSLGAEIQLTTHPYRREEVCNGTKTKEIP